MLVWKEIKEGMEGGRGEGMVREDEGGREVRREGRGKEEEGRKEGHHLDSCPQTPAV